MTRTPQPRKGATRRRVDPSFGSARLARADTYSRPPMRKKPSTRRAGHARVHGPAPRGRQSTWDLVSGPFDRADRQLIDQVTLGPTRRRADRSLRYWVKVLTLKPQRVKAARLLGREVSHRDGGGPTVAPHCRAHFGERCWSFEHDRRGRADKTKGFCPSCKALLELDRGRRIPRHKPGPPQFTHCPECAAWLPAWYPQLRLENGGAGGSYSPISCPVCAAATDRGERYGPTDTIHSEV